MYSVGFDLAAHVLVPGREPVGPCRGDARSWEGGARSSTRRSYFGYVLPSLTALLIARRGLTRLQTWFSIGASTIMLLFLAQGGGRRIIMVAVGAALIVWVQAQPGMKIRKVLDSRGRHDRARVGRCSSCSTSGPWATKNFSTEAATTTTCTWTTTSCGWRRSSRSCPAQHDFVYWRQISFTLVRPIPRVFWPGKPIDPGFDLPSAGRHEGRQPLQFDPRRVVHHVGMAGSDLWRMAPRPAGQHRELRSATSASRPGTPSSTLWPSWFWWRACGRCRTSSS